MFLSLAEINTKYDGEWIYAIDCQEDDIGNILGVKWFYTAQIAIT